MAEIMSQWFVSASTAAAGKKKEAAGLLAGGPCGIIAVLVAIAAACLLGCGRTPTPGHVQDEAMAAGRVAESFPAAGEDYFHDMDGGIALTPDEIKGRNTWLV